MRVFFELSADEEPLGRVEMELFDDVTPRTAENFKQLCTGEPGFGYKGSKLHRVIPGFMLQVRKANINFLPRIKYLYIRVETLSEVTGTGATASTETSSRTRTSS